MRKILIILLLVFAANVVKGQTNNSPKIHLWVKEGLPDYTIPNELWKRLQDSRLFLKLGELSYDDKYNELKENDFIVSVIPLQLEDQTTCVTLNFCKYKVVEGKNEQIYLASFIYVASKYTDNRMRCINECYDEMLRWFVE